MKNLLLLIGIPAAVASSSFSRLLDTLIIQVHVDFVTLNQSTNTSLEVVADPLYMQGTPYDKIPVNHFSFEQFTGGWDTRPRLTFEYGAWGLSYQFRMAGLPVWDNWHYKSSCKTTAYVLSYNTTEPVGSMPNYYRLDYRTHVFELTYQIKNVVWKLGYVTGFESIENWGTDAQFPLPLIISGYSKDIRAFFLGVGIIQQLINGVQFKVAFDASPYLNRITYNSLQTNNRRERSLEGGFRSSIEYVLPIRLGFELGIVADISQNDSELTFRNGILFRILYSI